jgi:carbon storage regulator
LSDSLSGGDDSETNVVDGFKQPTGTENMLILTRRPHEVVRIGTDVTVVVLGIQGNQVRVGITAPADIPVDREEIALRKDQQRRERESHQAAHRDWHRAQREEKQDEPQRPTGTLRLKSPLARRQSNTVDPER